MQPQALRTEPDATVRLFPSAEPRTPTCSPRYSANKKPIGNSRGGVKVDLLVAQATSTEIEKKNCPPFNSAVDELCTSLRRLYFSHLDNHNDQSGTRFPTSPGTECRRMEWVRVYRCRCRTNACRTWRVVAVTMANADSGKTNPTLDHGLWATHRLHEFHLHT